MNLLFLKLLETQIRTPLVKLSSLTSKLNYFFTPEYSQLRVLFSLNFLVNFTFTFTITIML